MMGLSGGHAAFGGVLSGGAPASGPFTEGTPGGGIIATFHDTDPNEPASNLFANINWGDATNSTGLVVSQGPGQFGVLGNHIYGEEGSYLITVTASDGGPTLTITGGGPVFDAPLSNGSASTVSGMEGNSLNQSLAFFDDANPAATAADFTSTINWGDNTSSQGTVTQNGGGQFVISGTHTYADEGSYTYTINTLDDGGSSLVLSGAAQIGDAPLLPGAFLLPPQFPQGVFFNGPVATFFDVNPSGLASEFSASINWGDNSAPSLGTIQSFGGNNFGVLGQHTYTGSGQFHPIVTISDEGGGFGAVPGVVTITPEPASLLMIGAGVAGLALASGIKRGARAWRPTPPAV
jgi:hypothetical protein